MLSALDVAAYIAEKQGPILSMKLQKLVYYSQAWSIVWNEKPLFYESIEAWAFGPVVRCLFDRYPGGIEVDSIEDGDQNLLTKTQRGIVDSVLKLYGDMSTQELTDLVCSESPWKIARKGKPWSERGNEKIDLKSMSEYYGILSLFQKT